MIAREIASRIGREEVGGREDGGETASSFSSTTVIYRTTVVVTSSIAVIRRMSTVLRREIGKCVSPHDSRTSIAAPPSSSLPSHSSPLILFCT